MLKELVKKLWKSEGQEAMFTPSDAEATFQLTYRKLEIGTLSLKAGNWTFNYSEAFKAQDKIKPLTDFQPCTRSIPQRSFIHSSSPASPVQGRPGSRKSSKKKA